MNILILLKLLMVSIFTLKGAAMTAGLFPGLTFKRGKKTTDDFNDNEKSRAIENGNLKHAIKTATDTQHLEGVETLESYESGAQNWQPTDVAAMEQSLEEFCRAEQLETYEGVEDAERFRNRKQRVARRMHGRYGVKGGRFAAHRLGQRHQAGSGGIKGQVTMQVTRQNYNYQIAFPVELFNPLDIDAGAQLINQYLPNGYSYSVGIVTANGGPSGATQGALLFTFWANATPTVFDYVYIQTQEVAYNKFLQGLLISSLQVGGGEFPEVGGTIQLSDTNAIQAFQTQWIFAEQNILGKGATNPMNPGSFLSANQFLQYINNIKIGFPIDAENGLIFTAPYITAYTATSVLTLTFFWNFSVLKLHNHKRFGL